MIGFLSPLFLIGALAAAAPIVLHLIHRRTEPVVEFAAFRYLRRAPVEQSRRRRVRDLILLVLRAGALCLLALAFARPYLTQAPAASTAPATVVLLDRSASMSAPGRFEQARALADEVVRGAASTAAVGVVVFGGGIDAVAPISLDRAGARSAIRALHVGAGAADYNQALARASDLIGGRGGRVVVITDLQQGGWNGAPAGVPENVVVEVRSVGGTMTNVAVLGLRVEAGTLVATVRNFSSRDVAEQVTFAIDGAPFQTVPLAIAAGRIAEARATLTRQSETRGAAAPPIAVSASLLDRAGYAADNVRHAVIGDRLGPSVLVVTSAGQQAESLYLERALTVAAGAAGFRFRAIGGPAFGEMTPEALAEVNMIALFATRGLERRGHDLLDAYVRSGGGLLLTAGPAVDTGVLGRALTGWSGVSFAPREGPALVFAGEDRRHPVFRLFETAGSLANVAFTRTARITSTGDCCVVARYSDGSPALVEEQVGAGRVLAFASDLNHQWNDFPLQPAYVPFVHELVRYLAAARSIKAEYVVGELPGPDNAAPGVVTLATGRRVAVNVDAREMDVAVMAPETFHASVSRLHALSASRADSDAREREDGQRLWQAALVTVLASLVAEGALGRKMS